MPIPGYQEIMLPLLQYLADEKEHRLPDAVTAIANHFDLTEEERKKLLPSGTGSVIRNRTGWARTYMKKAGLIESTKWGVFRITSRGKHVLSENPPKIDARYLEQFPEFVEFRNMRNKKDDSVQNPVPESDETPEEALESAYDRLRGDLETEILEQIKAASPEFFERLVVELLVKMGYGGSLSDAGQAVGRSGDGGIDGIIKEDRLGLDAIYLQAKRWDNTVGRPEIQKFAGALQGHRARKGVFLTTAQFSKEAHDYVGMIESKIVLIDGATLASLMIDHKVGVSTVSSYEVKKIDTDYFSEDGG